MFLYAYADIMHFTLQPGSLKQIMAGDLEGFVITPAALFGAAAMMTCTSMMIAASAILKANVCRWLNVGYAFSTLLIPVSAFTGDTWGYYYLFNFFEAVLTSYVVWRAFNWPRDANANAQ